MESTTSKGINRELLKAYRQAIADNPELARRAPKAEASWIAGQECEVRCDGATLLVNGEGNLSPMSAVLAALAGCDLVTVAVHAALLGIDVEDISVEVRGEYDARALVGLEGPSSSAFDEVSVVVRVDAPEATAADLALLEQAVGGTSPVGTSLTQAIPVSLSFENIDARV